MDTSTAYVRFVHGVSNAAEMNLVVQHPTLLLENIVATSIAYKNGSAFVKIPQGIYNLYGRYPATPMVNTMSRLSVTFLKGRVYTVASRGNITIPLNAVFDNTANR